MGIKLVNNMEKEYDYNLMMYFEGDIQATPCVGEENQLLIKKVLEKNEFSGKVDQKTEVNLVENGNLLNLIHVGMGKKEEFNGEIVRKNLFKALKGLKGNVLITGESEEIVKIDEIAEAVNYVNYSFDKYKEKKEDKKISVDVFSTKEIETIEGEALGKAVCIARDLINEPANVICPKTLAAAAVELGEECGFETEIKDEWTIEMLGMKSFISVARAADRRPRLIVMRHLGDPENPEQITGLVGKGLTYDTGGLSLKPSTGMVDMKCDMGGAATVIGSMTAIAKMKLKKNVIAVVAACENSIGGNAYRPGDIIGSMNGKTIEVTNTDAEGRLTLNDAITYSIRNENVTEVIDVATLTGGVMVALGTETTGIFTNTPEMYEKMEKASKVYGEQVWRLPLFEDYKKMLKSDVADLINSAGRMASAGTAAKFLEQFVEDKPWMHLDIAGTAFSKGADEYYPKGATGKVVRALYGYVKG